MREVDLAGTVFDVEHAYVRPAIGDDLPAIRVERTGVGATLARLIPPPDGGDVVAHGGLVQPVAELAVGGGGRPQHDRSHAAAGSGHSIGRGMSVLRGTSRRSLIRCP